MIKEFRAFFEAFQRGKELTNATTWKSRTLRVNALVALLAALVTIAAGFGYRVEVDQQTLQDVAAGIGAAVAIYNSIMHVLTSERVGVQPRDDTPTDTRVGEGTEGNRDTP